MLFRVQQKKKGKQSNIKIYIQDSMWLCIPFYPEHIVREQKGQLNDWNRHLWLSNRVLVFAAGQKPVTNVYHIPKYLKIENGRMGYKANIHSRHLFYHDSWVKFKVFVLNNKNMTVNGSMSCHNITAFRIHPTLCFPVLRNTKSAGLKIFWHFWYAKHVYYAYLWVHHHQILWGFNCSTSYSLKLVVHVLYCPVKFKKKEAQYVYFISPNY